MATFPLPDAAADAPGDRRLTVLRIDPARARLVAVLASERGGVKRTAGEWCRTAGLAAAINLGMFKTDHRTNVGHLTTARGANNPAWVSSYQSVLALHPSAGKPAPAAVMVDLDEPGARARLRGYATVIQNLRLIRGPGRNVWKRADRRWSQAAVAMDGAGRVLFLFCRTPLAPPEFNRVVLGLPLDVKRAMHVEGGPEASLSIHAGGVDQDLFGSFETGFTEDDGNRAAWPIPNVLGVMAR